MIWDAIAAGLAVAVAFGVGFYVGVHVMAGYIARRLISLGMTPEEWAGTKSK